MEHFTYGSILVLMICGYLCLYRIARGPTVPDRAVAIDILGTLLVALSGLLCIRRGQDFYITLAAAWALLNFVGTIALGKWLEGRGLDE